ncbi:DUF4190 domain-containing protein [Microbacterium sp. 4R-513]|uniref:DUF4190 domain-containing protein n=1 Tax=Microbacterium sp. 4R-513 TaxID=2567934 RepID=UPI0013E1B1CB|nr:DUF4190 domain-containing protein [Microbacterium sp. 4R-513]QIG38146.1 DUF4190 domain-containing protein [Microbacterium sp. 4R-513]
MSTPPADGSQPPAYNPPPAYNAGDAGAPQYGSAPPPAPQYGSAPPPAPQYAAAPPERPGRTLGIVAFILSFFVQLIALILGIVALVQSRKAGQKNGWALAAIIISAVLMILGVILFFAIVVPLLTFSSEVLQACQAVDFSGTVEVRGIPVDCSTVSR